MAHFNSVPADIMNDHGVHPVPSGKWWYLPGQINVSSTINMQRKGYIKKLLCSGLLLPFYELTK